MRQFMSDQVLTKINLALFLQKKNNKQTTPPLKKKQTKIHDIVQLGRVIWIDVFFSQIAF